MATETTKRVEKKKAKGVPKKATQTKKMAANAAPKPRVNWREIIVASKKWLLRLMGSDSKNKSAMADAILDYLLEQPAKVQKELFGFVLTNYMLASDSGQEITHQGLTTKTWEKIAGVNSQEIDNQIKKIVSPDLSSLKIISRLWDFIIKTENQEKRIFILSCLLHDYGLVPLLTDEERQSAISLDKDKIFKDELRMKFIGALKKRIEKIQTSGLNQWWDMAAALLYEVKHYSSPEDRAMAMAVILLNSVEPTRNGSKDFPGIISLSDEDIEERKDNLDEKIKRLVALFKSGLLQQAPAKGSAILNLILSESDEKSQVILMAVFLKEVKRADRPSLTVIEIGGSSLLLPLLLAKLLAGSRPRSCGQSSKKAEKPESDCKSCLKTQCPLHPINGEAGQA
ncbi:MAG: hypothetical protein NTX82_02920 [Candidatus Parcubacteria bacterium]|nr:hypothetical protein [Candidatus Parcubacteria bacterium]